MPALRSATRPGTRPLCPSPAGNAVKRPAEAGNPASANPSATLTPTAWSAANVAPSHPAPGVCACVSWLPLGSTGRTPTTVKANTPVAEGRAVAEGGPAAGDPAEHPGSTATMHRDAAQMTGRFASIRWGRRTTRASHGRPHADQGAPRTVSLAVPGRSCSGSTSGPSASPRTLAGDGRKRFDG